MAVDLHTHSTFSDGSDDPEAVVELAVGANLSAVALTDHDCVDDISRAVAAAAGRIEMIPGVELSVRLDDATIHLLGYWVDADTPLGDSLGRLQRGRAERNSEMVAALRSLGIDITDDEVAARAGHGVAGRPHIAALLVAKGIVATIPDAFDQYLAPGRPAYRGRLRFDLSEAVDLIHRSGGVAVVAHPHTIADGEDRFRSLFERLRGLGVDGIECHYATYAPEQREHLAEFTMALGMVPTGGSDYHGSYKPDISLGTGLGDLAVPDEVVSALRERRA